MCRLVAYSGEKVSPAPLVFGGTHSLCKQSSAPKELLYGTVNADGYGVVWFTDGLPRRIADARPIWHDELLPSALEGFSSNRILAALRNASPGIPIDRTGVPPLVHERWTFALNGFVPQFRRCHMREMRAELPRPLYAALHGSSDTETLFLLTVAALQEGASLADALAHTIGLVRARVGEAEAQLTIALGDADRIVVARTSTVEATNSLYVASRHPLAPSGSLVASERLDEDASWEPVPPHHLVELAPDGAFDVRPV